MAAMPLPSWWDAFLERVAHLEELVPVAIQDGERDTPIRTRSLDNARTFAAKLGAVGKPSTFIAHDGMARLVWDSGKEEGVCQFTEQVAIKFREDHLVDFVFFRLKEGEIRNSRIMGIAHVDAILKLVAYFGLDHVMTSS